MCYYRYHNLAYEFIYVCSVLQLTDDTSWAQEMLDDVNEQCSLELTFNINIWIFGVTGEVTLPNTIEEICPANCNGRGTCNFGK